VILCLYVNLILSWMIEVRGRGGGYKQHILRITIKDNVKRIQLLHRTFNLRSVSSTSYGHENFLTCQPSPYLRASVLSDGDRLYLKRSL
jgi:hypothetical protein